MKKTRIISGALALVTAVSASATLTASADNGYLIDYIERCSAFNAYTDNADFGINLEGYTLFYATDGRHWDVMIGKPLHPVYYVFFSPDCYEETCELTEKIADAIGGTVTKGNAGEKADRRDGVNYSIIFDEPDPDNVVREKFAELSKFGEITKFTYERYPYDLNLAPPVKQFGSYDPEIDQETVIEKLDALSEELGFTYEVFEPDRFWGKEETMHIGINSDTADRKEEFDMAKRIYEETGLKMHAYILDSTGEAVYPEIDVANSISGDANCDGKLSIADSTSILQALGNPDKYGLSPQGSFNADIYEPGSGVTGMDAVYVQMIDAGIV